MNLGFQKQNVSSLEAQRNGWIGIAVLLGVSTLTLSLGMLGKAERVILVPPQITRSFWVQGDDVSSAYLEEMGVYMAKLLLDLSPNSLEHNHKVLLRYATPEAYGKLKQQFFNESKTYTDLQLTTHFKPISVTAHPEALRAEVKGTLISFVASKEVKSELITLHLTFTHRGNGLLLSRSARLAPRNAPQKTTDGENHDH